MGLYGNFSVLHSLSFFGSGEVSKELSEDNWLVRLFLISNLRNSSIKSSKQMEFLAFE